MIHIVDNKGKNIIKPFYYSQFENNFKFKYKIYKLAHNKDDVHIYCDCCKKPIPLTIAKLKRTDGDDTIYLKNMETSGEKHNINCKMHKQYHGISEHELGWTVINSESGITIYEANPSKSIFKMDESDKKQNIFAYKSETSSEIKVTLLGLATKLNMLAWIDYQHSNKHLNEMPKTLNDFEKQLYGSSQKIKLKGKKKNLQDYWFNPSNANTGDIFFIMAPLSFIDEAKYPNGNSIENMINIHMTFWTHDNKEYERSIQCNKNLLNSKKLSNIKKKHKNGNHNSMVCGFVKKYKKYFEFESIEFLSIIPQGLWIENNYERQVFSKLIKENISFYKPFESLEYYNGYTPEIIFCNSKSKNKPYIGEIILNEKENKKIIFAENSKNIFDFWYWKIDEDIPQFYE